MYNYGYLCGPCDLIVGVKFKFQTLRDWLTKRSKFRVYVNVKCLYYIRWGDEKIPQSQAIIFHVQSVSGIFKVFSNFCLVCLTGPLGTWCVTMKEQEEGPPSPQPASGGTGTDPCPRGGRAFQLLA